MENSYLNFLTLIICLAFTLIANRDEKKALLIIVFSLSFLIPFQNNYIPMGITGVFIIILTVLRFTKRIKNKSHSNPIVKFSGFYYSLYYLLLIGIFMGLINTACGNDFTDAAKLSNTKQIYNLTTYFITIICFINLLMSYGLDFKFQDKLIKSFSLAILVHFIIYIVFQNIPAASLLFNSINSENDIVNINEIRFMSLIGDYELTIDYVFITICFCLISFYRDRKRFHIVILLIAIFIGVVTGTRSFLVIGIFYLLGVLLTNIKKNKLIIVVLLISIPLFISSGIWSSLIEKYTIFSRFNETIEQFNNNEKVDKIANRDFSKATSDLISNTNILGNGSFNIYKFNGNEMVSHNIFLAMYAKFGLPGLIILLWLLFYTIKLLIRVIKRPADNLIKKESILYLIIFLGLIIQELKISALRNVSILLIYTFFIYNIYCIYTRNRVNRRWKTLQ